MIPLPRLGCGVRCVAMRSAVTPPATTWNVRRCACTGRYEALDAWSRRTLASSQCIAAVTAASLQCMGAFDSRERSVDATSSQCVGAASASVKDPHAQPLRASRRRGSPQSPLRPAGRAASHGELRTPSRERSARGVAPECSHVRLEALRCTQRQSVELGWDRRYPTSCSRTAGTARGRHPALEPGRTGTWENAPQLLSVGSTQSAEKAQHRTRSEPRTQHG